MDSWYLPASLERKIVGSYDSKTKAQQYLFTTATSTYF
jgi:hypothetical protein